ncbi:MAG TPA: nitrilase-related carbon-nitrogen hydrolase [Roseiflexaceae bacterium]|nr:nitrilase-related carbon-nitrogen hydrolase [Roseiflexaceae bacterium]
MELTEIDRTAPALVELGRRAGHGNLLGVQPWLTPADYASARALYVRLERLLAVAARAGRAGPRTIVVLPEYVGTWLVVAGAPAAVLRARSVGRAMPLLIAHNAPAFLRALAASHGPGRLRQALFRMRAPAMARTFHTVCSVLARNYGVTLVAGSILLPEPHVAQGELRAGSGPLRNVAAVYHPSGAADQRLARKVYPVAEERGLVAAGDLTDLPVYETPAGRLGIAVCADSWYPQVYEALRARGAELIAVPSYLSGSQVWRKPWRGYNGAALPPDVSPEDVGHIAECEAWRKYALAGRAGPAGFRAGINVFLRGALWDLGADGVSLGVRGAEGAAAPERDGAALINVWL